nr:splicing factor 3A subunit 2-like [Aegilops tauschii subsp. strangulata]
MRVRLDLGFNFFDSFRALNLKGALGVWTQTKCRRRWTRVNGLKVGNLWARFPREGWNFWGVRAKYPSPPCRISPRTPTRTRFHNPNQWLLPPPSCSIHNPVAGLALHPVVKPSCRSSHSPAPELHPDIYLSLHSTPSPQAPSQGRAAVFEIHIQPPSSGRPLDIQPSSSPIPALLLPGPHLRLPPLLHLLLPGLHLWAPAAAGPAAIGPATAGPAAMGPAAAGDPSPSSCAPLEASRRHALSVIQARKRDGEEGASAGMMVRQPQRRKAIPIARQHYFRHLANWCTWT